MLSSEPIQEPTPLTLSLSFGFETSTMALTSYVTHLGRLRHLIEDQYREHPTGCGNSFGEILCYELHSAGLPFDRLAIKWGLSLATLGELIWDHCKRLEPEPEVKHHGRS